jgi:hypothetical protein
MYLKLYKTAVSLFHFFMCLGVISLIHVDKISLSSLFCS